MVMLLATNKGRLKIALLRTEGEGVVRVSLPNGKRYQGMITDLIRQGKLMESENYGTHWTWAILLESEKVVVVLEADNNDPFMNIQELYSFERGKGYASKAMKKVVDAADKWGVNIELDVEPFSYEVSEGVNEILDGQQLEIFTKTYMNGIDYFHRII